MSRTRSTKGRGSSSPAQAAVGERARSLSVPAIERVIAAVDMMDLDQLRAEWTMRFGSSAPRCRSKEVIRGLLAWRIQANAYGGMSSDTTRRLRQLAAGLERPLAAATGERNKERARTEGARRLKPGTVLTREWRGTLHKVHVLENSFVHAGRTYRSLSEIARTITGTHWSGPRFFGLIVERKTSTASVRGASC